MLRLRIKEIAESKGFNMSSLSRASDVSFTTVKRLWQKPYSDANTATLEKLAKALDVAVSDLLEQVPDSDKGG